MFVDTSGRRARLLRRIGLLLGTGCLGYTAVLGAAFMGWGTSLTPSQLLPFAGAGPGGGPGGAGGPGGPGAPTAPPGAVTGTAVPTSLPSASASAPASASASASAAALSD
ncbi:hypothetical protein [Streptomyces olindensis]|uniref:hypothetical protein n=1 Tax=Streptomyces olindensis TaxID=358823 RepID=UPI0033EA08BF